MIELPKKRNGEYIISYSQIKAWNELKGYNTGRSGKQEYMMQYFFNQKFEDKGGFAEFGNDIENYITKGECKEKFSKEEREILDGIKPLGIFQHPINIKYDGFTLIGFIDDCSPDFKKIRDYKGASESSSKKYYEDDYHQLDLYALGIKAEFGFLPTKLEVCVIERKGNGFKGGRKAMNVGENVWYIERKTNKKRLDELNNYIINTVKEISKYYKVFKKLNIKKK